MFQSDWNSTVRIADALISDATAADPERSADDVHPSLARARKLLDCCRSPQLFIADDDLTLSISTQRCRSRLCPVCARSRARDVETQVREAVKLMDDARFLTLTLKSTDDPLADQIRHLTRSFRRLRQRKLGKTLIDGGVYTIEVTWNPKSDQWHPHLHAIIDGRYIPQAKLADEWFAITTDSRVVDIRRVHSATELAHYLSAYVAKTQSIDKIPADRLVEWSNNVHGLRFLQSFGNLHGKMPAKPEPPNRRPDSTAGYLSPLAELALTGDTGARELLHQIHQPDLRIVPDPARESAEQRVERIREIARRVRTFQRDQENAPSDRPNHPTNSPGGRDPPVDRPKRLWEDDGPTSHVYRV